ncbi:MAG: DMT family transporter [Desulfobacteraceae bacterium]
MGTCVGYAIFRPKHPGTTTMCYQLIVISLMLLPFVSFDESLLIDNRLPLLLLLGVVFTAAPHVLLVASLRHIKATSASLILCLHPMYSILFAAILISEIPSFRTMLGGLLIICIAVSESIRMAKA